jgi:hypothetical protein
LNGIIFIIIIVFVIIPLVKKIKESMDAGGNKNRNRYSGYNNPNVYNRQNDKRITYDWKPDYGPLSSHTEQLDQSSQGNQDTRPSPGPVNAQTSSAAANTRPSSATANTRPSAAPADARPISTVVSGSGPASAESDNSRKRTTAAPIRKKRDKGRDTGMNAGGNVAGVHVSDTFLKHDAAMPEYDDHGFSIASYDVPESSAFKFSDITVDAEVRVDAVIPDSKDTVRVEVKDKP